MAADKLLYSSPGSQFNVPQSKVKNIKSGRGWGHIADLDAASSTNQRAA
ncbi:MAG: hypothetical protein AAGE84_20705 [Cyanobacteria bacterium P01_G01_bin.39]